MINKSEGRKVDPMLKFESAFSPILEYRGSAFALNVTVLPQYLWSDPKYKSVAAKLGVKKISDGVGFEREHLKRDTKYTSGRTIYWDHYECLFNHGCVFWAENRQWVVEAAVEGNQFQDASARSDLLNLMLSIRPTSKDVAITKGILDEGLPASSHNRAGSKH